MINETRVDSAEGRRLHVYDTGQSDNHSPLAVFWLHGTPNLGAPPAPLFADARRLNLRWVSYDRPGYGGSTPQPGRSVAAAADDIGRIADALGIDRFAVLGHSGGGPHALACGARLAERVVAVVSVSGSAPYGGPGLDWFAGMAPAAAAELGAATMGRAALEAHLRSAESTPDVLTPDDLAALAGPWAWLGAVYEGGLKSGFDGFVDDDLAFVSAWGFDPTQIAAPTLILHGERDRIVPCPHGLWLAEHCPAAELRVEPEAGHLSVLASAPSALEWIRSRVD
ncbi:MAG: alpha/beta hydrolase [Anaerolineales bacterium]|nr:alpha/beta hydrolase [Anaerolineales bacterium]